ncbi:trypsin-like serine peptidase [Roseobacteraceae bacterium S113]
MFILSLSRAIREHSRCAVVMWCCGLVVLGAGAMAHTKDRLDTPATLAGWAAIGRVDMADSMCTGTLVARDLVLTAAHCVVARGNKSALEEGIIFRAGRADGQDVAARRVVQVMVDPSFRSSGARTIEPAMMVHDIALLRLESPIESDAVVPFGVFDGQLGEREVTLVSYGEGRSEALTRERGCAITGNIPGGLITLDCDATFGSSGAPIILDDNGQRKIVSIISAIPDETAIADDTPDTVKAYGMDLARKLAQLKVALRNSPGAAQRVP